MEESNLCVNRFFMNMECFKLTLKEIMLKQMKNNYINDTPKDIGQGIVEEKERNNK